MIYVDPEQFIITRKRKKYKFALFANSPLCFELDEWSKQSVDEVEIGAGTGLFSVELATLYPGRKFLALDIKADRLQKGAKEAEARRLQNIWFVRARADQLAEIFEPNSLESIWLTFPDPYPKKRSAGRRLTHANFLKLYQQTLSSNGHLQLKHDNLGFFCWSLEQLVADKWQIDELSFDLHNSDKEDYTKIMTTYEKRWMGQGATINYLKSMRAEQGGNL